MGIGLREAGRLALLAKGQLTGLVVKRVVDYVVSRQNMDGGYTFCQGTESNAQDTYYGLAILNLLGFPPPNVEKTVEWLRSFVPDSLYSHYYVAKALGLCGEGPNMECLKKFVLLLPVIRGEFGAVDVYAEVASEFLSVSMAVELANMVGAKVNHEKIVGWLLNFENSDGGFGAHGHSNLNSTYYAVTLLSSLGYPVRSLKKTLEYVRACEKPYGGFTVVPNASTPYMEHTYHGASTLNLLGERLKYPNQTAELVLKCQNANGGFARSDIGISTFEDTFYAVSILKTINSQW
ncbi:MAG: prenyltransferase/squalene oxidase repeat-containing protein [Candidatus Bathyarchaeia archaeon]